MDTTDHTTNYWNTQKLHLTGIFLITIVSYRKYCKTLYNSLNKTIILSALEEDIWKQS
jgi:hypothetical protein